MFIGKITDYMSLNLDFQLNIINTQFKLVQFVELADQEDIYLLLKWFHIWYFYKLESNTSIHFILTILTGF